jgi:hypothetical protein
MVEKTQERQAHFIPTPTPPVTILHHLQNIHRLNSDPHEDLAPTAIDLLRGDTTNVRSPSIEVLVIDVQLDVPGAHRDLDQPPEMCPLADRNPDD